MSEMRRGWCPECPRSCALTSLGRVWAHNRGGKLCPGTGRLPHPMIADSRRRRTERTQ